jgi:serine protease AprX
VAPGRKIVSVRVPGSTLDRLLPTHIEGPTTFRLTGTSESVAVAGGSVALVLAERSRLTPDQVKATVTRSANQLAGVARSAQGSGEISVTRALAARTPSDARQKVRPSDALLRMLPVDLLKALLGDLGHGRGGDDNNTDDGAQVNPDRLNWDRLNWDRLNWDRLNWDQLNWDQLNWDRLNWDRLNWDQLNWDRLNWDQLNWDRLNWDQLNWDAARLD